MEKKEYPWMCGQCYGDKAFEVGRIGAGYSLIYADSKFHILGGEGHGGDEIYTFDKPPTPNPDPNDHCDGEGKAAKASFDWSLRVDDFRRAFRVPPPEGVSFLEACRDAGYDPRRSGDLAAWVFNYCGLLIEVVSGRATQSALPRPRRLAEMRVVARRDAGDKDVFGIYPVAYGENGQVRLLAGHPVVASDSAEGLEHTVASLEKAFGLRTLFFRPKD